MKYIKDIVTLTYNSKKCIACKRCVEVCPHQVFVMAEHAKLVDKNACIECGACQMNCPTAAIKVTAGVGCASAIIYNRFKNVKLLRRFFQNRSC